jgi:hypothetical protein
MSGFSFTVLLPLLWSHCRFFVVFIARAVV